MKKFKIAFISSLITILFILAAFAYLYYIGKLPGIVKKEKIIPEEKTERVQKVERKKTESVALSAKLTNERKSIITDAVKKVSSAIVGINVTEIRKYRSPWSQDPFFREFFGDRIYQQEIKSLGSGAIISPDGYILTNDHVAGNAVKIIVTMTNGNKYDAKLVGTDHISDIALLKIKGHNLPFIKMGNSDKVLIGEWAIALGNPFGLFEISDKPTVTVGVISATGMNLGLANDRYYFNMIQTDAAINSGNSGGPLVNVLGELIGMNTLIFSKSGGNVGVGFAIPINKIKRIVNDLKTRGYVDRNFWTGLSVQTVDAQIARYYGLKNIEGVIVTDIIKDSPADKAGFKIGDIILFVNKFKINSDSMLVGILQEFEKNDIISIRVLRSNQIVKLQMKLEARND